MSRVRSFSPIIDAKSRILILGSMPGIESLRKQEYYGYPRNQFWNIIYGLFGEPLDNDYERKVAFLRSKGIALWDVIETCSREGSLDSNIKEEKVNDFTGLFEKYPNIKHVFFNGLKAYDIFKKKVGIDYSDMTFMRLGSTSPANVKKFADKFNEWMIIKDYLPC